MFDNSEKLLIFAKDMKQNKLIETADMSSTLTDEGKRTDGVSFGEGYSIVMNTLSVGVENWTKLHVPYRTAEFRILLITEGSCRFYFNLMDTFLRAGDVLLLKPGVLCEQNSQQEAFNARVLSLNDGLPEYNMQTEEFSVIHPDSQGVELADDFFSFIYKISASGKANSDIIHRMISAFLALIRQYEVVGLTEIAALSLQNNNRNYLLLNRFLKLLNKHGCKEHRIAFYASKLSLTPNYLNNIIRKASGQTMSQWINRFLITEAKVALTYDNKSILDISEELGFPNQAFFTKFFKRHTGQTPSEFKG